jgi:hypothetical protein
MKKLCVLVVVCIIMLCSHKKIIDTPADSSNNENTVAMVFDVNGTPAVGATVKVFEYSSTSLALKTETDTNGRYSVAGLNGVYSILSQKDSLAAFQDSVSILPDSNHILCDTLRSQSSFTAQVGMQPGANFQTVTAEIIGTDIFANITSNGRFTLSGMAEGTYRLRLSTTLPNYTTTYFSVYVTRGAAVVLTDTLWLIYTWIPIVKGLKAVYDTFSGIMNVTWNSTKYQNFQEYLLYRQNDTSKVLPTFPIAIVTDTLYNDTIYQYLNLINDTNIYSFKYKIKIRDKFDKEGSTYGYFSATAYPPAFVKTFLHFTVLKDRLDTLMREDTLKIALDLKNRTRNLRNLKWIIGSLDSVIKTLELDSTKKTAVDTLSYLCRTIDTFSIYAISRDIYGMNWIDSCKIDVQELPIEYIKTNMQFHVLNDRSETNDTIRIAVDLNNQTRNLRKIKWATGSIDSVIKTIELDTTKKNAVDTFNFVCCTGGIFTIFAINQDVFGTNWIDSCQIYAIPKVNGLKAEFDAIHGVVNISWNSVQYPKFQSYELCRQDTSKGSWTESRIMVSDTIYKHIIYQNGNWPIDTNIYTFQYRVRIYDQIGQEGPFNGLVRVTTYPLGFEKTNMRFKVLNAPSDTNDMVRITLELNNKIRNLKSLKWAIGSIESIVKTIELDSTKKNDVDTLSQLWPSEEIFTVYAISKDVIGGDWIDSCKVYKNIPRNLILWNKLGSTDELEHSIIGPNGSRISYLDNSNATSAVFGAGKFGGGLVRTRVEYISTPNEFFHFGNDSINNSGISIERGCIEFWWKAVDFGDWVHGYWFVGRKSSSDRTDASENIICPQMCAGWNSWDYGEGNQRTIFADIGYGEANHASCELADKFSGYFEPNQWYHLAVVWDVNGIQGDPDSNCIAIYRDGVKLTIITRKNYNLTDDRYIHCLWMPGTFPTNYAGGGAAYYSLWGTYDNIKVWNYAKTDFSDRFTE